MSITLYSDKAVVASWTLPLINIGPISALHSELLRRFPNCTALHFDVDRPCYFRVLVRADGEADILADEIKSVILGAWPTDAVKGRNLVKTRIFSTDYVASDSLHDGLRRLDLAADELHLSRHPMSPGRWCAGITTVDSSGDIRTDEKRDVGYDDEPDGAILAALRARKRRRPDDPPLADFKDVGRAVGDPVPTAAEINKLTADAARYKHAASALWQVLDSIAEIDSIGDGDDARFRLDARQLAKLRLDHADRIDGKLMWSWQGPHIPEPEWTDVMHAVAHGPSPGFLERFAEAAKAETQSILSEASGLSTATAECGSCGQRFECYNSAKGGMQQCPGCGTKNEMLPEQSALLAERIAEAAKTATADKPVLIEMEPEKYDAADCIRIPPNIAEIRAAAAAVDDDDADLPPELIKTATIYEAGQPIDSVGALMPEGLAGFAPASKMTLNEAMAGVHPSLADVGFEPYRGPLDEHTTEEESFRWSPDAKSEVAAIAKRKLEADYDRISVDATVLAAKDPAVVTVSQFAAQFGVSPEQVTVKDGKFSVSIPTVGSYVPVPRVCGCAVVAPNPDCPECDGTGEQAGPDPFNPPCEACSSDDDDA